MVGGRSIRIEEVSDYLRRIYDDQYKRFEGKVAPTRLHQSTCRTQHATTTT